LLAYFHRFLGFYTADSATLSLSAVGQVDMTTKGTWRCRRGSNRSPGSFLLATGRQPGAFSEMSCRKSYTQIWIFKGGTGGGPHPL